MASKGKKSTAQPLPIVTDPEMAERFERELAWCCEQLEWMMGSSSSSKEKEARKIRSSGRVETRRKEIDVLQLDRRCKR